MVIYGSLLQVYIHVVHCIKSLDPNSHCQLDQIHEKLYFGTPRPFHFLMDLFDFITSLFVGI